MAFVVEVWSGSLLEFPENFKFGAATSSYQIEGAWNVSDKTPSIWDNFVHRNPEAITDLSHGDVACDSYNQWKENIQIASDLGLNFYRFSISWPRILPSGFPNQISKDGVRYYKKIIDGLLERNIEPLVTIFHWELPQRLQNLEKCVSCCREDEELAELATNYFSGLYSYPIYSKDGGWPANLEKVISENSEKRGFKRTRLPAFSEEEKEFVKGTGDFYGLNYYTSRLIRKPLDGENVTDKIFSIPEFEMILEPQPNAERAASHWLYVDPEGLRRELLWLKKSFGDIEIIITENGYSTSGYSLKDMKRIKFLKDHLKQVLLAVYEDNINVTAYTMWSLMDNFEWLCGYSSRFGIYEVNFEDPLRKRTPRASAQYYSDVIKNRSLQIPKKYDAAHNKF